MKFVLIISFMWPGSADYVKGGIFPDAESCHKSLKQVELKVSNGAESEWGAFKACLPLATYKTKYSNQAIQYPGVK